MPISPESIAKVATYMYVHVGLIHCACTCVPAVSCVHIHMCTCTCNTVMIAPGEGGGISLWFYIAISCVGVGIVLLVLVAIIYHCILLVRSLKRSREEAQEWVPSVSCSTTPSLLLLILTLPPQHAWTRECVYTWRSRCYKHQLSW